MSISNEVRESPLPHSDSTPTLPVITDDDREFYESLAALQQPSTTTTTGEDIKKTDVVKKPSPKVFEKISPNTIFVRGLPYTVTDKELEKFFEEVGPLRQCFVVKQAKTDEVDAPVLNRGYGYVHYALKEDAEKAIATLSKVKFMGRLLNLDFADRRASKKERDETAPTKKITAPRSTKHNPNPKTNEIEEDRTVVLSNLPKSMGKARLHKFLEELDIKPMSIFHKPGLARVLYETVELAQASTARVQNKKADGQALHATILTNLLLKTKHARLIVRNASFKLREHELEKIFDKQGPVLEVKMPRKLDGSKKLLGFGFVQYLDVETAEKAMKALNGTEHYGRPIIVDFCVSRAQYNDPSKATSTTVPEADSQLNDDGASEEASDDDTKSDEEKEKSDTDENFQNALYEEGEPDDIMDSSESEGEPEPESDNPDSDADQKGSKNGDEKPFKLRVPPECTLFVRNILFETTEEELFEKFSEFGKLRYARIVVDKLANRSRGTGFVSFVKPADARACLEMASQFNWSEESSKLSSSKSILVPEGPRSIADKFTLNGRLVFVSSSVSKDKAEEISGPTRKTAKEDKRNYYLLREGVIFPGTPLGKKLEYKEVERRLASYNLRRKQINSNPSLFVAKTRLSIRNLPLTVDDKELRTTVIKAFNSFKEEVKTRRRDPLTAKEMEEGWDKKLRVIQAKLVRSKDRIDATTGLPKSTGFGFVEVQNHAHALAILRYLNCNPDVFPRPAKSDEPSDPNQTSDQPESESTSKTKEAPIRGRLLTVEFAIENKLILKRRDERVAMKLKRQAQIEETPSAQSESQPQSRSTGRKSAGNRSAPHPKKRFHHGANSHPAKRGRH